MSDPRDQNRNIVGHDDATHASSQYVTTSSDEIPKFQTTRSSPAVERTAWIKNIEAWTRAKVNPISSTPNQNRLSRNCLSEPERLSQDATRQRLQLMHKQLIASYRRSRLIRRCAVLGTVTVLLGGGCWFVLSGGGSPRPVSLLTVDNYPTKSSPDQLSGNVISNQNRGVLDKGQSSEGQDKKVDQILPLPEEPLIKPTPLPPPEGSPSLVQALKPDRDLPAQQTNLTPPGRIVAQEQRQSAPEPVSQPTRRTAMVPVKPVSPGGDATLTETTPESDPKTAGGGGGAKVLPRDRTRPGSVRVQLASVKVENAARSELNRLRDRFPEQLKSLKVSVVRADLGDKGVFYRVQAGPMNEASAGPICSALRKQNVACIVLRQ